jgi:hypothetical protein
MAKIKPVLFMVGISCLAIVLFVLPIIVITSTGGNESGTFADRLKYSAEVAGNLFICFGVVIAIRQLYLMEKGFIADHERRKKQATIEFYNNIQKEHEELLKQGVYIARQFYRLREIILYIRKNSYNPIAYQDFETLVSRLGFLRNKRFPEQDTDFAKIGNYFGGKDL